LAGGFLLASAPGAVAVDGPLPGLWKVTTASAVGADATPAQVKIRCLRPVDVEDLEKTFTPEFGAQGSACRRLELTWSGQKLSWHIQCTGPLSMDVAGSYEFDTPQHYSGMITTFASIGGREMRSRTTLDGERLGECPTADDKGQPTEKKE
jgi:hypothetical protein